MSTPPRPRRPHPPRPRRPPRRPPPPPPPLPLARQNPRLHYPRFHQQLGTEVHI